MVVVKFLPRAEKDFSILSEALQDEVFNKCDLLSKFPQMGCPMEKAYFGYRSLLVGHRRYRIVYRVTRSDLVEIVSIRHCRRQMGLRLVS